MKNTRNIVCPQCGSVVRIPLLWVIGLEVVFRCKNCRRRFKTGYKMGAALSALGLSLSMITVQILVYLFSIYSLSVFMLALIPLWIFYAFHFRKWYMLRKIKRAVASDETIEESDSPESQLESQPVPEEDPEI